MSYADRKKGGYPFRGNFLPLPHNFIESKKFADLSGYAFKCLAIIARQYSGNNNGSLHATFSYMKKYGIGSKSTLTRALKELKAKRIIYETRKGKEKRCALYGLTWFFLDYDKDVHKIEQENFPFEGYLDNEK